MVRPVHHVTYISTQDVSPAFQNKASEAMVIQFSPKRRIWAKQKHMHVFMLMWDLHIDIVVLFLGWVWDDLCRPPYTTTFMEILPIGWFIWNRYHLLSTKPPGPLSAPDLNIRDATCCPPCHKHQFLPFIFYLRDATWCPPCDEVQWMFESWLLKGYHLFPTVLWGVVACLVYGILSFQWVASKHIQFIILKSPRVFFSKKKRKGLIDFYRQAVNQLISTDKQSIDGLRKKLFNFFPGSWRQDRKNWCQASHTINKQIRFLQFFFLTMAIQQCCGLSKASVKNNLQLVIEVWFSCSPWSLMDRFLEYGWMSSTQIVIVTCKLQHGCLGIPWFFSGTLQAQLPQRLASKMAGLRQLRPTGSIPGKLWPWLIPWINYLRPSCLWAAISHHLGCWSPRQLCSKCYKIILV